MSTQQAADAAIAELEALAGKLSRIGFATTVIAGDQHPSVTVLNKNATQLSDTVYAAPDGEGKWWLWWSWAERIVPVGSPQAVETAAWKIAYVLTPMADPSLTGPPSWRRPRR